MKKEHCVFKTVVNDRIQEIWRRNETHKQGRINGQPDDLWLRETFEGSDDIDWTPWVGIGANRPCFEIKLVQGNRTKFKWNETRIDGTGKAEIICNKIKIYEFAFRDIEYGLARAQVLLSTISEHPFNFMDPESEIGRKIWYYEQPAVIDYLLLDQGCIMIRKEDGTGFDMSRPWDDEEDRICNEWHGKNKVKDDILVKTIYWFRDI
jgi:hypothetical protein